MNNPNAILVARGLRKKFGKVEAVRDFSIELQSGRCLGLLGPNGAGKTTTLEMLEGIRKPDSGEILFHGEPLGSTSRERCGIQFQHTALPDYLSVREVLHLFSRLYEAPDQTNPPLDQLVQLCHLEDFLDRDTHRLSGGQRQRVLLAVALINRPELVFLDEPTTGLDPQARRNFWELIRNIKASGTTILLSTHYMEEAYALCDEIAIMDHGRIIARGAPGALLREHFDAVTLQLPKADFESAKIAGADQARLPQPLYVDGFVELQTSNLDDLLRILVDSGTSLKNVRIREQTLEDLFISLTGRDIRA